MRTFVLVVIAVLLTAGVVAQVPSKADIAASTEKITELRKERIAVLRNAAEASARLAQSSRIDAWEALNDELALVEAELDAATTETERIGLYEKAIAALKNLEQLAKAQKEAARATELPRLRINARRLEMEIRLEQARIKAAQ